MKRNLVGIGTSVRSPSRTEWSRRTNAIIGRGRKSTSPTRTLEASAFWGIFRMKLVLAYGRRDQFNAVKFTVFSDL